MRIKSVFTSQGVRHPEGNDSLLNASNVNLWPEGSMFRLSNGYDYTADELLKVLEHMVYEFVVVEEDDQYKVFKSSPQSSGRGGLVLGYPRREMAEELRDLLARNEWQLAVECAAS
jgi:hypothetical protein